VISEKAGVKEGFATVKTISKWLNKVLERARSTMLNITVELVPQGTHTMSRGKKEMINAPSSNTY
jgi:hypothetical protein